MKTACANLLLILFFLAMAQDAPAATLLRQSAATTVTLGPFLDETDGKTAETGMTLTSDTLKLSKNGAVFAQKGNADTAAHDSDGWYRVGLSTTDTGTLGRLMLMCHESGALPVWREFKVVPSNVYDSLIGGTDDLDVQVSGMDAGVVTASAIAANAITSSEIADGAITDAKVANDVQVDVLTIETVDATTQIQSSANAALVALNLDHLLATATSIPAIVSGTYWDDLFEILQSGP